MLPTCCLSLRELSGTENQYHPKWHLQTFKLTFGMITLWYVVIGMTCGILKMCFKWFPALLKISEMLNADAHITLHYTYVHKFTATLKLKLWMLLKNEGNRKKATYVTKKEKTEWEAHKVAGRDFWLIDLPVTIHPADLHFRAVVSMFTIWPQCLGWFYQGTFAGCETPFSCFYLCHQTIQRKQEGRKVMEKKTQSQLFKCYDIKSK